MKNTFLEDVATFAKAQDDTWAPSSYKRGNRKGQPCMRNSKGESRDMTPDELSAHKGETPSGGGGDQTPREAASAALAAGKEDYAYARQSAIPNLGEDVKGSARHVRNRWTGNLATAEADGTAEELVKRDQLLKNEPPDFPEPRTDNALAVLAAHLALSAFPPDVGKYRGDFRHTAALKRSQYLDAYRAVKAEAEAAAKIETSPFVVMDRVHKVYAEQIRILRGIAPGERYGGTDRGNPIANNLIDSLNRTQTQFSARYYKKNSVGFRVLDFGARLKEKYGDDLAASASAIASHVKDVVEGDSYNETFGKSPEGSSRDRFDPSKLYVEHAERVGGPVIDAATVNAGLAYVGGVLGMRGLQWGNSVSDEERQHHLQKSAESFADLTDVLGLPPQMASYGGKLALAIGARGKGTALAHYETSSKVINLTRKKGVGSLAHEWGHFLDDVLAGGNGSFLSLTAATRGDPLDPANVAMMGFRRAMESSGFRARLRSQLGKDLGDGLLSQKKANYWFGAEECFARCFERHVQVKLEGLGRKNTYLSGVKGHAYWPGPEEVAHMAPAFDALLAAARDRFLKSQQQQGGA